MPIVQEAKPRPLCPTGLQEFVLADVTPKVMPRFDGEGENMRWIWRFVGNKRDPETGEFYEVVIWTGTTYGDPRAKLTWLEDLLLPDATEAQKKTLNTDTLLGCHYEGMVKHDNGMKDTTQKFAAFAYLRPVGNESAPDPFAFDDAGSVQVCAECGGEVDDNMAKNAIKRFGVILCHPHGRLRMTQEKVVGEMMADTEAVA